jgi:3-phenylpropionate/cinnamic acid dioxygenase small subunit
MKVEDELKITKLITDYMCWWDDRVQHQSYPAQLDERATWELWQIRDGTNVRFQRYQGKAEILACKTPHMAMVHSTSNLVVCAIDDSRADVRAYFRTYYRDTGQLWTHGEGRYEVNRIEGEWKLMSIKNQYYWIDTTKEQSSKETQYPGVVGPRSGGACSNG